MSGINNTKVAFVFNKGRSIRLQAARDGLAPKEFFLGALELEARGYKPGIFEIDPETAPGWLGGIVNVMLSSGLMPEKLGGGVIGETRKILARLSDYDFVVGTTSSIGFALALFKKLGKLKADIAVIHCGLLNNPYGLLKKKLTALLLKQGHTVLYGEGELFSLSNMFPNVADKVTVNQFGVDAAFWLPDLTVNREKFVLSIGNDGRRDYETLISAARKSKHAFHVVTSRELPGDIPSNVKVTKGSWHSEAVTDSALRDLYRRAGCVAVTLSESYQPSGQSVALQALACGTPVIITETHGLWADDIRKFVTLVKPMDVEGLVTAIDKVMNNRCEELAKASSFLPVMVKEYSSKAFADRMEIIIAQGYQNRRTL